MAALAAILGHAFPVWLTFRGGKGVEIVDDFVVVTIPEDRGPVLIVSLEVALDRPGVGRRRGGWRDRRRDGHRGRARVTVSGARTQNDHRGVRFRSHLNTGLNGQDVADDNRPLDVSNPATGEDLMLRGRRVVTFKCSGKLREKINS